jgi:hypothetical protein
MLEFFNKYPLLGLLIVFAEAAVLIGIIKYCQRRGWIIESEVPFDLEYHHYSQDEKNQNSTEKSSKKI